MLLGSCFSLFGNSREEETILYEKDDDTEVLGTWWWWVDPKEYDKYLDFAVNNGVNEIYFYTDKFSDADGALIEKAGDRGIKVYFLKGGYTYIWDRPAFAKIMDDYFTFQAKMPAKRRFAGLHLDIEPQMHKDYTSKIDQFHQDYIDFVVWVNSEYREAAGTIDFDMGWWFDGYVTYNGNRVRLYQALISEIDRPFVMAYKNTADKIYDVAKDEIAFAKSIGKPIMLGVETDRLEPGSDETFYGKGLAYLYDQLEKLHKLKKSGAISQKEFDTEKKKLLGN